MKRALVFGGGGSRGAYEIGVWQALQELDIRFHAVYGTSIGAINAALAAQGDLETALHLWANIDLKQILDTEEEDFSIDHMVSRKRDVIPFLLENAKHLHVDTAPLRALMARYLSEGKVRASGLDFGIMTVRVPQMQAVPMRLTDMASGTLSDWVMASASCFPVFPLQKIGGERYMDGGYFDNLPIDMAIADSADEILAVDLHPQPQHAEYRTMPFLKMIHPLHNLGGFLDFNPALLLRTRRMGYYDAMKTFRALDGIRYTFSYQSDLSAAPAAHRFMKMTAAFDAESVSRRPFSTSQDAAAPLIGVIGSETPLRTLSFKEVHLRGLELCAECMGFREDAIYDPDLLNRRILEFAKMGEVITRADEHSMAQAAAMSSRELVSYLYRTLTALGAFPADCMDFLVLHPRETAAALYLFSITPQ